MSLRCKPLEWVDELKIALLLMQAASLYLCCFATNRLRSSMN